MSGRRWSELFGYPLHLELEPNDLPLFAGMNVEVEIEAVAVGQN